MKIKNIFSGQYWAGIVFLIVGIPSLFLFLNIYPLSNYEKLVSFALSILAIIISIPLGINLEIKRKNGVEQNKIIVALFLALASFGFLWIGFSFLTIY
jgi:hypothetical protein